MPANAPFTFNFPPLPLRYITEKTGLTPNRVASPWAAWVFRFLEDCESLIMSKPKNAGRTRLVIHPALTAYLLGVMVDYDYPFPWVDNDLNTSIRTVFYQYDDRLFNIAALYPQIGRGITEYDILQQYDLMYRYLAEYLNRSYSPILPPNAFAAFYPLRPPDRPINWQPTQENRFRVNSDIYSLFGLPVREFEGLDRLVNPGSNIPDFPDPDRYLQPQEPPPSPHAAPAPDENAPFKKPNKKPVEITPVNSLPKRKKRTL